METAIRRADAGDAEAVRSCIAAAFELYIARMGRLPGPMTIDVQAHIAERHVWLAERAGEVVGALVQYTTEAGFYIDTVAVDPRLQKSGVGKALLEFAEQEARRCGFDSLYLCTNAHMTENQVFYPRIGYVEIERKRDAGYDRIFYRKRLGAG